MSGHCAGAIWNLPVKIRAQKLASLPAPFNDVRTSNSAASPLNSVTPTTSSASASSTSLTWTPMKTDNEQKQRVDDARTPTDKLVAGISVLKQDKLDRSASVSSSYERPNNPVTSMNNKTDSHMDDVDISDIENSLTDVSRCIQFYQILISLLSVKGVISSLRLIFTLMFTHDDESRGSKEFSRVCLCV